MKSRVLDWAVASEPGLPGICGGKEEAVITFAMSVVERGWEEKADGCWRFAVDAGMVEGTGSANEANSFGATEVDGDDPWVTGCVPPD